MFNQKQVDFLNWEFGVFFHFGIRTFYEDHRDWDMKEMPLEGFCPTDFSADSWCKTISEAGAAYAVLTCKHHDGFANWPSAYTDYSVKNTPWKNGNGDVVREFCDACRKYSLKVGLYYSPAQFGSKDTVSTDYDNYFINQISELLTNYGKIDYLWFDGCGSEGHHYDEQRIIAAIRSLQPDILIFNMWDPDTGWCQNELGYAPYPNPKSVPEFPGRMLPLECDCRIRDNWFYYDSDAGSLKSLDALMGIYELSVGRGANLLLNIGPDRRGRLPDADVARLLAFGDAIRALYADPIAIAAASQTENYFEISFEQKTEVSCLILEEDLSAELAVEAFTITLVLNNGQEHILYSGKTIGHKAICRFPTVICDKLRVNITHSSGEICLKNISAYR